jgi:hypothetical protein
MSISVEIVLAILMVLGLVVAPVDLVWGWVVWIRSSKSMTVPSVLSWIGFAFATFSALLAIGTFIYAQRIHGFGFYDPLHMKLIRWGSLLSATGLLFGLCGVWRRNPLRWHSLLAALGTLAYWVIVAEGE